MYFLIQNINLFLMNFFPSIGYEGTLCESNINNCQPDPCHHGTCIDGIASYTCNCEPGYTGYRCENQLNECHSNPCQNGGKCMDQVNKYICQCQHGTSGKRKIPQRIMYLYFVNSSH